MVGAEGRFLPVDLPPPRAAYRRVSGKRTRVNTTVIAGKGGGLYSFLDRKAPKSKTVRYWIQAVNMDGSRSWYGPARVSRT